MRKLNFIIFVFSILTLIFTACATAGNSDSGDSGAASAVKSSSSSSSSSSLISSASSSVSNVYIVDHSNLDASLIPTATLAQIKALDVYFEHASVGGNIQSGLTAMKTADLTRYGANFYSMSSDNTTDSLFMDNIRSWFINNDGFTDHARGNPGFTEKFSGFNLRIRVANFASSIDVASFKFCYIDNDYMGRGYSTAADAFNAVKAVMEGLETQYPAVKFFWWTMPIQTSGSVEADSYNMLVRNYCKSNNKYLLDIADIECHSPAGVKQIDSNGYEILYSGYTTDGGHLNDAGKVGAVRVANAYWVLLARICGWTGN